MYRAGVRNVEVFSTAEAEKFEQVANRRAVQRNVRIACAGHRVREIVAAAVGHPAQPKIALDELQNRDVIRIVVSDVPAGRIGGHHDQWNARSVAEIIQRLNIAGIIIPAALVEREKIAVLAHIDGLACTASTIFLVNPSKRSSFEDAG